MDSKYACALKLLLFLELPSTFATHFQEFTNYQMELKELVSTVLKTLDSKSASIKNGVKIDLLKTKASMEKSMGDINNKYQIIQDYFKDIDGFVIYNDRQTKPVKEASQKLQRSLKNYLLSFENDLKKIQNNFESISKMEEGAVAMFENDLEESKKKFKKGFLRMKIENEELKIELLTAIKLDLRYYLL